MYLATAYLLVAISFGLFLGYWHGLGRGRLTRALLLALAGWASLALAAYVLAQEAGPGTKAGWHLAVAWAGLLGLAWIGSVLGLPAEFALARKSAAQPKV